MLSKVAEIERLNISGTCVTREGLRVIANSLPNLKVLTANCCRLLNPEDRELLQRVTVDINEDVFRFHLEPTPGSKLPHITSNVLRTRSSLSILRVSKYIRRRLDKDDIEVDVVFEDKVLTPYQTLNEIAALNGGSMLNLQYRLKEESQLMEQLRRMQGHLIKFPRWTSDETNLGCEACQVPFSLWNRRHHCRKCGRLLCGSCTPYLELVPELGYTKEKVRVCVSCRGV
mmetsp:Transcript_19266/g.35347  ORF Transcript_19266/g.35347 Transcript_19266/m.35347 type:complete len:229 (+) Transcript_19266:1114-1800(+)